jgi:predicted nucleic acid-binding protein
MRVLVDNNIILDALLPNKQFETIAKSVNGLITERDIPAYICANSLTDIFYFLKKAHNVESAKKDIAGLIESYEIISLTADDCATAISLEMNDFEDAIITVCARKMNVDYIISRDKDFISTDSIVKVISPTEFLNMILKDKK